ncbi:MAG: hypothetical protein ABIE94_02725 [archaeon]
MNKKLDKNIKELVLWRLDTSIPNNLKLAWGKGSYTKEELIKHVEQEDEIGLHIVNLEMEFIKDLASGRLSGLLRE